MQVLHVLARYVLRYATVGWGAVFASCTGIGSLFLAYSTLHKAAEPMFGASGELIDAGADLGKSQALVKDALWACIILLPLVGITAYAWWLAGAALLGAAYLAWQQFVAPMLQHRQAQQEASASSQQRQERAAKRAERRRMKYR